MFHQRRERILVRIAMLVLAWAASLYETPAFAEILPTTGTFEGVYHRDRWGVGQFDFFVVDPALHSKLAKFDGKLIRLRVTDGDQPINPGPSHMHAIDRIEELPQLPIEITARTRPETLTVGGPFQLIVVVKNTSKTKTWLYPSLVISEIRVAPAAGTTPTPELACRAQMGDITEFNGNGNLNGGSAGQMLLPTGASYVWVASFPNGIGQGQAEWEVLVGYALTDSPATPHHWKKQGSFKLWREFPVMPSNPTGQLPEKKQRPLLHADNIEITESEPGWQQLQFVLRPATGKIVRVPGTVRKDGTIEPEKYAQRARLEGFAADGSTIELEGRRLPERETPQGLAQLMPLPATGAKFSAKFRPRASASPVIARMEIKITTDQGVETIPIPIPAQALPK